MRPGRERPGKEPQATRRPSTARIGRRGFNEAGARTPRKAGPSAAQTAALEQLCFNEAGARTPRKAAATDCPSPSMGRFNEAGARTPRKDPADSSR